MRSGLARAAGFLRGELGRRLGLRHAPRLEFVFDESVAGSARTSPASSIARWPPMPLPPDSAATAPRDAARADEADPGASAPDRHAAMPSGILLLDKPAGLSSNAALQRVRGLFGRVKGGHVGSLDPLATGMLPICLGEATKVAGEILAARKCYRFAMRLGARTDHR